MATAVDRSSLRLVLCVLRREMQDRLGGFSGPCLRQIRSCSCRIGGTLTQIRALAPFDYILAWIHNSATEKIFHGAFRGFSGINKHESGRRFAVRVSRSDDHAISANMPNSRGKASLDQPERSANGDRRRSRLRGRRGVVRVLVQGPSACTAGAREVPAGERPRNPRPAARFRSRNAPLTRLCRGCERSYRDGSGRGAGASASLRRVGCGAATRGRISGRRGAFRGHRRGFPPGRQRACRRP